MRLKIFVLLSLLSTTNSGAFADALSEYVAECKEKLEISHIPGNYSCFDGTYVPNSTKFGLQTNENYLGKVTIWENPAVDAVFLCRTVSGTGANATAGLNGYILQNRDNGNTCFFDVKSGKSAITRADLDSPTAAQDWRQPKDMDGAPCIQCHNPDPYIVSPGLAEAFKEQQLFYNGRNLTGPYNIVGNDLPTLDGTPGDNPFYGEQSNLANWTFDEAYNCASGCHKTSSSTVSLPMSGYMPPSPGSLYTLDDPLTQNDHFRIQNYWNFNAFIGLDSNNDVNANGANWNTIAAEWTFEKYEDFYRIKSAKAPNEYLHMENGVLESGPIQTGWWAAHWILEPYSNNPPVSPGDEGKVFHIKNRWTGKRLHVEYGTLEAGNVPASWWSTRWKFDKVN